MKSTNHYHDWMIAREAERGHLTAELKAAKDERKSAAARLCDLESARQVVNDVLLVTQGQAKRYIEEVVGLALSTVYGQDYGFELDYQIKRNQPEVTPWILRGEERFGVRDEVGGGVLDVVSLALRLALWAISVPKPAPIFILDEPGRFLSRDKQRGFGQMLREVSKMLGVQILLISHSTDIIEQTDKAYEVTQGKGISGIKEIG